MSEFADIEDLVAPFDTVSFDGKTFQVRGLTASHIVWIVNQHGSDLAPLYQQAAAGKLSANASEIASVLGASFLPIMSAVIACGLGKPTAVEKVDLLPIDVQMDAIDKIMRLTIRQENGLGKIAEIVSRALTAIAPQIKALKT